ncbi:sensor histidine kinase [Nakamurella endophytica]|uniref:Sensor-like histidine kinase SenX3 n=1 Tax=Nakamurella endophytica TaxID=1748367 RepID=A0A917WMJ2_9ACTN|nr:ATP-binding protein [Nakamurella endophytica]GGM15272.1 two-component sensor histidine kinase [Nakamurella endophytica]
MSWFAVLGVAAAGVLLGVVLAALVARYRRRPRGAEDGPVSDAGAHAQLVLARSPVGHVLLDASTRILYTTPAAGQLGVVRAGLPHPSVAAAASRALASGEPVDVELRGPDSPPGLFGPRPAPMTVHVTVRPLRAGPVLVVATDDTEGSRLEAVRRDFVANVSHELKTPVSAMSLLAEAVVDGADDPDSVRRFGERLVRESTRMGALVSELLTLSRLQGADPLPDLSVVEVDGVIGEGLSRASTLAENAGITLVRGPACGLLVLGDRPMLVTALSNLIDNAVHYSPSGTAVSVSCRVRDGYVEVSVTDRGIGIPAEHLDRVFERFFRVDPARSRATGGTGLGLAIVKHVAANHGGEATVWSKPGTGSTFTLRLPLYRTEPDGHEPDDGATGGADPAADAGADPIDAGTPGVPAGGAGRQPRTRTALTGGN